MIINGIKISERKLEELTSKVGSANILRDLYAVQQKTDSEISEQTGVSARWICNLRKIYGIETDRHYSLRRNKNRFEQLSNYQMEFLRGSLFGDSCIAENKDTKRCFWICGHGIQQEDYLLKKADIMKSVLSKVQYGERPFEKDGKMFKYVRARSVTFDQLSDLRKEYYPNGVKCLSESVFRKLTGRSFAFWFFDDGSSFGYGFDITTFDNEFKDPKYIRLFKEVLDLDVSIHWNGSEGNIHILRTSHDKAWSYIQPEMVESMWHKIPYKYRQGNQQPSLNGNVLEGSTTGGSLNCENNMAITHISIE